MPRAVRLSTVLLVLLLVTAAIGCIGSVETEGDYKFGRSVEDSERDPIRAGVDAMKAWLEAEGDVHLKRLSVEVDDNLGALVSRFTHYNQVDDPRLVAQWLVAGGAMASGDVIYIYVGPEWEDYTDWQKSMVAAHEVFHVAQYGFLFDDWWLNERDSSDRPPTWLIEGGADYAAARALDVAGIYPYADSRTEALLGASAFPGSLADVSSPEGDQASGDAAPYALGFLALERLAAQAGEAAMFDFWDALAEAPAWEFAFAGAFNVGPEDFVAAFDATREAEPPHGGLSGKLVREDGSPVAGATVVVCTVEEGFCHTTWTSHAGEFILALEPGTYEAEYRVANREGVERGKFELGGEQEVVVASEVLTGLSAAVREPL